MIQPGDRTETVHEADWDEVAELLNALYQSSSRLEQTLPGRKFTLDGHLVGSTGEVMAAHMFDLKLNPASTLGHDAVARDGRDVEVKFTQGRAIAIRHEPDHLIVLQRPKSGSCRIVFNGPGSVAWQHAGRMQSNGQRPISVSKLLELDKRVREDERLVQMRAAPV